MPLPQLDRRCYVPWKRPTPACGQYGLKQGTVEYSQCPPDSRSCVSSGSANRQAIQASRIRLPQQAAHQQQRLPSRRPGAGNPRRTMPASTARTLGESVPGGPRRAMSGSLTTTPAGSSTRGGACSAPWTSAPSTNHGSIQPQTAGPTKGGARCLRLPSGASGGRTSSLPPLWCAKVARCYCAANSRPR